MRKALKAGELNRYVIILEPVQVQDEDSGNIETTWVPFARVWAKKQPLSAREFLAGDARQAEVTTIFTIRTIAGIVPSMRIQDGNSIYNIKGLPLPDDRSGEEWLSLMTNEVLGTPQD